MRRTADEVGDLAVLGLREERRLPDIHVFGGAHLPIFLATVFARNEKDNPSMAGKAALITMG